MPATNYLVKVKTGSKDYGGTDAKVNIELIGAARTHRQRLDDPNNDDFEKGHLDAFRFATEDVGWLEQIKISHDDSGDDAGWYVEYVEVHNQRYVIVWRTSFDRWLASDEGDKKTTATAAVPVSAGTVEADRIVRQYLGYQVIRRKNDSSAPLAVNEKFSNSFNKGLSMTTSEARSVSVKAAIDATFFDPGAEVIVVNDGSSDDTADTAARAGATVVSHPYGKGNGASIKTGARTANGNIIVFMDADGQHKPEDIESLLSRMTQGYDMVVGARQRGSQASVSRGIANRMYNKLASFMVGHRVEDLTSGFRAVKAEKFKEFLYLLPNGFSYPTTITSMAFFRAGYSVGYEPIHRRKESRA